MDEGLTSVALTYAKGFEGSGGVSGILISSDFVLTHGSLLNAVERPEILEFFQNITPGESRVVPTAMKRRLNLLVHRRHQKNYRDSNNNENSSKAMAEKSDDNISTSVKICGSEITKDEGTIVLAWKCPLLKNTFDELSYGWNFGKNWKNDVSLLSIFLVVKLERKKCSFEDETMEVRRVLDLSLRNGDFTFRNASRGSGVEISSTPFGNPVFIDSISRGVVSNRLGDDGCLVLTDANAVPGSEGAPVYATRSDGTRIHVCGMVIAPLSWCRGEWVDYTFAASLLPCLRILMRSPSLDRQIVNEPETNIADTLDKSLVLVRCGDGWGTGIIFDARTGTIITCSHVVQKAPKSRIKVVLRRGDHSQSSGPSSWARLVYRTARDEPYDVAVLRLDPREIEPTLRSIKIANDRPVLRGESVGSAGFPFFSSRFPTITRGNVSGIDECMLRTTCCIQSGSSGGPIVRWSNGEMLGMVVCNAITTNETPKLFPRLNMAIPVSILEPSIRKYLRTGDVKALDALTSRDPSVKKTWNFRQPPLSKI